MSLKSYVVGGAVRDRLLGLPVSDRDHVVVGATVDEMLAAGFKPVGKDFPVFLHPVTHEEYALARTERKVAPGYAGFVFHADASVTLEEDLARRDLTINAMAEDDETGALIDPFDGEGDLARRTFRHVGAAFVEDPVRILRLARFAARFVDFDVAPGTLALMRDMVDAGEVDALVAERVWQELSRGLMEARPSRMIDVLDACGAWTRLMPELGDPARERVDRAADKGSSLNARFAILASGLASRADGPAQATALCTRLVVPRATRDMALLLVRELDAMRTLASHRPTAEEIVALMERCDAVRRGERFIELVQAADIALDVTTSRDRLVDLMTRTLAAATSIDAAAIARAHASHPSEIGERLHDERIVAVARALS